MYAVETTVRRGEINVVSTRRSFEKRLRLFHAPNKKGRDKMIPQDSTGPVDRNGGKMV